MRSNRTPGGGGGGGRSIAVVADARSRRIVRQVMRLDERVIFATFRGRLRCPHEPS
jgi:hypothetical protein